MKKFIIMLLSMLLLAANVVSASADAQTDTEKIMQKLKGMPKDEFISVLLVSGNNMSESGEPLYDPPAHQVPFMYAATAFMQRSDEFTNDELVEMAANTKNGIYMRETAVDVFSQKNNYKVDDMRLIAMLDDPEVPKTLKTRIIVSCPFTYPEGIQKLEDFLDSSDSSLSFHAAKKLRQVSLSDDVEIADSIIDNHKQEDEETVCSAIKIKSMQFAMPRAQSFSSRVDEKEFLDFCETFYFDSKSQTSKDAVILALTDMGEYALINEMVPSEPADQAPKVDTAPKSEEAAAISPVAENTDEAIQNPSKGIGFVADIANELAQMINKLWTAAVNLFPSK